MLDVIHKKAHKIIGNRSYSNHLKTIISLGNICIDFLRSKKIDPTNPATHSEILIDRIIRKKLNFKGLIISDDISMKALGKNIIFNAHKAIRSGCNLALYCGGNIKESSVLLKNMKKIDSFTTKKTSQFYKFLR